MENYIASREIRIFISSTFKDMKAERDTLVSTVFPLLRRLAANRRVDLVDIDLRTGITEEESQQSRVVEICLDEINKAHPFFIGILGERYGWVPMDNGVDWNKVLPERYHDTLDYIGSGLSMTEIEIKYGMLDYPGKIYGGFYLRDCDESCLDPRQKKLRDLVRTQGKYPSKTYTTVAELSEMITKDFTDLLDTLFPEEEAENWDSKSMAREAAMRDRIRYYIPRADVETEIRSFIGNDKESSCVLISPPGMGKSATLSKIALDLKAEDVMDTIAVFASDFGHGATAEEIASAVCESVSHLYGIQPDPVMSPVDQLGHMAGELYPQRPLCIILDGINQLASFNDDAANIVWWPSWNEGVKVIFSAPDDSAVVKDLKRICDREIHLERMTIDQRMALAEAFFKRYRKNLSPEIGGSLSEDHSLLDNTLIFTTLIDEVRRYGDFDTLEAFVASLARSGSAEKFFDRVLDNEERYFSMEGKEALLKEVLLMVHLSGGGLSENEIIRISGASRLDVSRIMSVNHIHLMKRNGNVLFAHNLFEDAVCRRYACEEDYVRVQRRRLVEFFKGEESSPRLIREIAYQHYRMEDWDALYKWISTMSAFSAFSDSGRLYVLAKYWSRLLSINSLRYDILGYAFGYSSGEIPNEPEMDMAVRDLRLALESDSLLRILSMLMAYLPRSGAAVRMSRGLLKLLENATDERSESVKQTLRAGTYAALRLDGQWREALSGALDSLQHEVKDLSDPVVLNVGEVFLTLYEKTKNQTFLINAVEILDTALKARIAKHGEQHEEVAVAYANLGSAVIHKDSGSGIRYLEKSLSIYESIYGHYNVDVAIQYHNLAQSLVAVRPDMAISYADTALEIYRYLFEDDTYSVVYARYALGNVYHLTGHKQDAVTVLRQVVGQMYSFPEMEGDYDRVNKYLYSDALETCQYELACQVAEDALKHVPESNVESVIRWKADLGAAGMLMHDYDLMDRCYNEAIGLSKDAGLENLEVEMHCFYGKAKWSAGQVEETVDHLSTAIRLAKDYGLEQSGIMAFALFNRAQVLVSLGRDIPQSISDIKKAIEIRRQLVDDEEDATLQEYKDQLARIEARFGNAQLQEEEDIPSGIKEEIKYMDDILQNAEWAEEFKIAMVSFSRGAMDAAGNRLRHLFSVLPDELLSARAMVLRYLAYTEELKFKNKRQSLPPDEILQMYDDACYLASLDTNYLLTRRISHDAAECAWSLEKYELAETYYFKEIANNLLQKDILQYSTILAMTNAVAAMNKLYRSRDYTSAISICSLAMYFMHQGGLEDEELEDGLNEQLQNILAEIEYEDSEFRMDFGEDCLNVGKYLLSFSNDDQILTLALQLLSWAGKQWLEREEEGEQDETISYYIECQYLLGHYDDVFYYAEQYLQREERAGSEHYRERVIHALVKTKVSCLDIRSAKDIAQQYGISPEWFEMVLTTLMPCYGNLCYSHPDLSRQAYAEYQSQGYDDPIMTGDLFYYEAERGNRMEAAKYLKQLKEYISENETQASVYEPALTEMEEMIK